MSFDLHLKPSCGGCGCTTDLYGSQCKHVTLCLPCGKRMVQNRQKCYECGVSISNLIREFNVHATSGNDKSYFIGRFVAGIPSFSKKKNTENKWMIHKDGLQGRHVTDALREKYRNKPWVLEDEMDQSHYHAQLEGAQYATYYSLVLQDNVFLAIPGGSWYNFNKVAQYKQLTLEEAEEKMKNRRKTADGYERWMMKAANNGPAAFGEMEKFDDKDAGVAAGRVQKIAAADDDEGNGSDRGEEDEEEEEARKSRLGLNKRNGDDDDGEGPRGGDHDFDDDDIEKGDDWEHEEIFTDDDEAVGNDPEEREDLAPEVPAPPEIKQDEEDEDEDANEEEGGLSKSGKELKKLLGKTGGLNESDNEDDDDDDEMDDEIGSSPVLAPKRKDIPKDEPIDDTPAKAPAGTARGTPSTSKSVKSKRKSGSDDVKPANGTPSKKVKTENESKSSSKDGSALAPKSSSSVLKEVQPSGPVTEDEIRAVLLQKPRVTTSDLVSKFKARLKSSKDKTAFADILKKISKIQKSSGSGPSFVVLREN